MSAQASKFNRSLLEFHRRDDLPGFMNAGGHLSDWLEITYLGTPGYRGIPPPSKSIPRVVGTKKDIPEFDDYMCQLNGFEWGVVAPLEKPNYEVRLYIDVKNWRPYGWNLPGNGSSYDMCGHIFYDEGQGCLSVIDHPDRKVYVRLVAGTCFRFDCPVCYQKACAREAGIIEDKFKRLSRNNAEAEVPGLGRPVHVVVSVPEFDSTLIYTKKDFTLLRSKIYALVTTLGMFGGVCIFHPYANEKMNDNKPEKILIDKSTGDFNLDSLKEYYASMDKSINFWYLRPHFHLIGYAPRDWDHPENDPFRPEKIKEVYDLTGYVVKNIGVRNSVRDTAHYLLSHCGVKVGHTVVTWFGALSNRLYHKLNPAPKAVPRARVCPVCEADLQPVRWDPQSSATISPLDPDIQGKIDSLANQSTISPLTGLTEGGYWIHDPGGGWRHLRDYEANHSCLIKKSKKKSTVIENNDYLLQYSAWFNLGFDHDISYVQISL